MPSGGPDVPEQYLALYLCANAFALAALALAFWRRGAARWVGVTVFAWAAAVNAWTALTNAQVYAEYASMTPSVIYRDFILGWFSSHVRIVVLPIAVGQLVIAALLASRRGAYKWLGVAGALVFLLAIAPLGVGSGFPFSLTFGAALLVAQGAAEVTSSSVRQVLWWTPRVLGVAFSVFLSVFALDAFGGGNSALAATRDFAIHLIPAGIVLAVVLLAWRWGWVGGALCLFLAVGYAAQTRGRVSWMLVVSLPLIVEGVLFLWSSQLGHYSPDARRHWSQDV